jgi:hypothetical protein
VRSALLAACTSLAGVVRTALLHPANHATSACMWSFIMCMTRSASGHLSMYCDRLCIAVILEHGLLLPSEVSTRISPVGLEKKRAVQAHQQHVLHKVHSHKQLHQETGHAFGFMAACHEINVRNTAKPSPQRCRCSVIAARQTSWPHLGKASPLYGYDGTRYRRAIPCTGHVRVHETR